MTPDHVPRLHELAPGLFAGLGYNGRGIAAATMMGRDLAALVTGRGETAFPRVEMRRLRVRGDGAAAGTRGGLAVSGAGPAGRGAAEVTIEVEVGA